MLPYAIFGIQQQRAQPRGRARRAVPGRDLAGARLLDLRRRAAADRRPAADRLRDRRIAVPVRRHDRLHDRQAARVPRRRARARARDAGGRGAARRARATTCARTATTRSRRTTCAAPTACASSRIRASRVGARSTRPGGSARSARPRSGVAAAPDTATSAPAGAAKRRSAVCRRAAPRRPEREHLSSSGRRQPSMERTLILVKPDAFARNLTGEIIARFERKGLRLVALAADDDDPRAGRSALRRARGQAVLRGAGRRSSPRGRWSRWCSRASRRSSPPAR